MKKHLLILLSLVLSMSLITGCNKQEEKSETNETEAVDSVNENNIDAETEIAEETEKKDTAELEAENGTLESLVKPDMSDINVEDYVEVGDYKSIKIELDRESVSDEDIEAYIQNVLKNSATYTAVTERTSKEGDKLNISFSGKIDGEEFEGGTAEDYSFVLGNGEFLEDFEATLYEVNVGDIVTADVKFPEAYTPELAGKTAEFTIVVNSIEEASLPELNDEFVKNVSGKEMTVAEFREEVKKSLEATNEAGYTDNLYVAVVDELLKIVNVKEYPEEIYNYFSESLRLYYAEYATVYGLEFEDFLKEYCDLTLEQFKEEQDKFSKEGCKQILAFYYIAEQEGITLTDEEYEERLQKYAEMYQYDSVDRLKEELASYNGEAQMREDFLFNKVCEYLVETYN